MANNFHRKAQHTRSAMASNERTAASRSVRLRAPVHDPFAAHLTAAADQFLVKAGLFLHGNRRLSLVHRLGPGHHDRAARPDFSDRAF